MSPSTQIKKPLSPKENQARYSTKEPSLSSTATKNRTPNCTLERQIKTPELQASTLGTPAESL